MEPINSFYLLLGVSITLLGVVSYTPVRAIWYALKPRITRKLRHKNDEVDIMDVLITAKLQERLNELELQLHNVVENQQRREQNRRNNIKREVRDYLEELKQK